MSVNTFIQGALNSIKIKAGDRANTSVVQRYRSDDYSSTVTKMPEQQQHGNHRLILSKAVDNA